MTAMLPPPSPEPAVSCPSTPVDTPSGGGGESEVPEGGAATTVTAGVDSTLKPAGRSAAAASTEPSDGPRAIDAACASASDGELMVMARRTEAASTARETRLGSTPAVEANLATMASRTLAV